MKKVSFEEWMKKVDRVIGERIGLSYRDLPDCNYHDWYDDGISYQSAAKRALKNANE